jgi:RNA polymerase sigma-70 factor, ECF subfamily
MSMGSQLHKETDTELLHRFQGGDDAAFEAIVHRYEHALLSYAQRFFRERERAEDMCQSVWLQLILSQPLHFEQRASLKPWLMTVLRNRCIDTLRGEKKALAFSGLTPEEDGFVASLKDGDALPEDAFELQEERQRVALAIEQLPTIYRTVLWLHTYHSLSCAQIAHLLSCDPKTVKTRLYRARPRLRQILEHRP